MKVVELTISQISEMLGKTKAEVNNMTFGEIDKALGVTVRIVLTPTNRSLD